MNKVADKIMPKELAKVTPYIAMAAPFLGPVGMLATLPAQALADAKNYGKLNYKKLALQAAMAGIAKAGQSGKALSGEQAFADANPDMFSTTGTAGAPLSPGQSMAMVGDTSLAGQAVGTGPILSASNPMALAEANPAAFDKFMESYKPSFGDRVGDLITKTGRSMYQPLEFGEGAPSISEQLFNMDRAKQAAFMLGPMTTYAGMDALDQMENAGTGGSEGTASGPSAQSLYDDFLQSGRLAGYTDEEINTIYGPYGDMASGTYDMVNVDRGPRRRQFPGTNYNLFTYANGGRVNKALGGAIGMALREAIEAAAKNPNLFKVLNPKEGIGQVIEMMKKLPKVKPRDRRTEGIDIFGKRRPRDIDQYQDEIIRQMEEMDSFANGGRAGYAEGDIVGDDALSQRLYREMMGAQMSDNVPPEIFNPMNPMGGPHKEEDIGIYDVLEAFDQKNKENMDFKRRQKKEGQKMRERAYDAYVDRYEQRLEGPAGPSMPPMKSFEEMFPVEEKAMGGRIGMNMGGGIMQAPGVPQGMELDYRNTGGFIPMGGPERADDVPAMLSKNEFVMTADAVRGMGDGDVNTGAQRMYDLMNNMEAKV